MIHLLYVFSKRCFKVNRFILISVTGFPQNIKDWFKHINTNLRRTLAILNFIIWIRKLVHRFASFLMPIWKSSNLCLEINEFWNSINNINQQLKKYYFTNKSFHQVKIKRIVISGRLSAIPVNLMSNTF